MNFFDTHTKLTSFEPAEFYLHDFSVDEFIQRKRYSVPLDVLRDDLGSHLKSLRSSLIELINQDYGQFVNLSSNLVGLDGKIKNILGPLVGTQQELEKLHDKLATTLHSLKAELEERRTIRTTQRQLQLLRRVNSCLDSSEKYLSHCSANVQTSTDFSALKIACDKIADTRQLVSQCLPSPLIDKLRRRCEVLRHTVLQRIQALFKIYGSGVDTSVHSGDSSDHQLAVTSILFMFTQLGLQAEAEDILIKDILKPLFDGVLAKKGNISALLDEAENFLDTSPIIPVSRDLDKCPWMASYNFLGRATFPAVISILIKHFPHIWSPSAPDSFHNNWLRCSRFIDKLEGKFPSTKHLEEFRSSDVFKEFLTKWQFNVYFQLRFHALAIEFEAGLESLLSPCLTSDFKLDATRILVKVITQCWDRERIFLDQLTGRFLKASALFISRYLKAINSQLIMTPNVTIPQLILISSDLMLSELVIQQILGEKIEVALTSLSISGSSMPFSHEDGAKFLSTFQWEETREGLEMKLIELTLAQSTPFINSVTEVSRLFRRTNRDIPTKPSEYVNAILAPVQLLVQSLKDGKQETLLSRIGPKVGQQILNRYTSQMDDVLTSVQRMEESLKRLKKVKNTSNSNKNENLEGRNEEAKGTNNLYLSDDDKIRRQIQIDFECLKTEIGIFTTM